MLKETAIEFRDWLESKPEDEVVGVSGHPNNLPFIQFLNFQYSDYRWAVGGVCYGNSPNEMLVSIRLPLWAYAFKNMVDAAGVFYSNYG